jgi:hypothetical protein
MGAKSNYLSNMLLNAIFNNATFTKPTTLYCALYNAGTLTAAGTGATEVSGGSYGRQAVTPNTTNFPTTSSQSISNGTAIVFTQATGSWGTITTAAFWDNISAGNMLYYGTLGSSVTVSTGNTFEFLIGGFSVAES